MSIDPKSSYYDKGGIEVIAIIKAKLTPEQYEGFLLGNAMKYILRCNWKENKQRDIEKAVVCLDEVRKHRNNDKHENKEGK